MWATLRRTLGELRDRALLRILERRDSAHYHEAVFTRIWRQNYWGDGESRSGPGSNLRQTAILRRELAQLLAELGARSLLDLPCGDFNWMKEVEFPSGLAYVGGDIVAPLVEANRRQHARPGIEFQVLNLLGDRLPRADLVLCRDCLVHFSFADIFRAMENLRRSGSTYLLTTHFESRAGNHDILTGQWRPLSLTRPPFCFPAPLGVIREGCTADNGNFSDKTLSLWRISDIPDRFSVND
jgi:SAM-dependent methyltransferase